MQRRAAAAYFVLFMVISAGAYAYIGMAEQPQIELSGESYTEGDTLTVGDRTYTVNAIGSGSGNLTWTDPEATYTATLEHNTTVSWRTVSWDDQRIGTATLANGSTVPYNGSNYQVLLNASVDPPTVRLARITDPSINETFELGETITLDLADGYVPSGTITEITAETVTMSWGDDYLVEVPNETDPSSASLTQQRNVTRTLLTDPAVENDLGTYPNGTQFVQYYNGSERTLDAYLPDPEVWTLNEGETLRYDGNETMIGNITRTEVPLNWTDVRTYLVDFSEGDTVDLNGQPHLVHFLDESTVQLVENSTDNYATYQDGQERIDAYNERKAGLWGVVILSSFAGILLLGLAYLPVKD
jgi:hypothetical protein